MIIFDKNDKSTWPKEKEPVLILYKPYGIETTSTAVAWWEQGRYSELWEVEGVSGPEFDTDFTTQNIIAWQPIPSWE
jgi:hypothetical protein